MKRHAKQLPLPLKGPHGGKRLGAGRPNLSGLRGHARRPTLRSEHPIHLTLKLAEGLPSLRRKDVFRHLRAAVGTARERGLCVVHFAILSNHIHFIMEPNGEPNGRPLAKQIQSLCISFARRLNQATSRKGPVFRDRYHVRALGTPTEIKLALSYVLANQARHEARARGGKSGGVLEVCLDPFSSALAFGDWRLLLGRSVRFAPSAWSDDFIGVWHEEILRPPRTWLLRQGWKRAASGGS